MLFPLSFFLVCSPLFCSAQLKPCYDINGNPSSQIPCDPSANVSACCAPGGVCVTNFYCHGLAVGDTHDRVGTCTDRTGNDPACPLPLLRKPGAWNWFGHTYNTTSCGDGTFCMNPGNETCCLNRKGVKEIIYHNNATIPTNAQAWTTYYENAGYSLPSTATDPSTIEPTDTSATTTAMSSREKAIIGTASALGALLILGAIGSLYLFRRSRIKRSEKPGPKDRLEAVAIEDTGLTGHRMVGEMDATWDRPLDEAHLGGLNELMGRDVMELRAELTGPNRRKEQAELPA